MKDNRHSTPQPNWTELYEQRFGIAPDSVQQDALALSQVEKIVGRRTQRRYLDKDIEPHLVTLLLMAAQSAPAKSDLQQYSIIQVVDPSLRSRIGELIPTMPWVASAPLLFVFCGDMRRNRRITEMRGYRHANDSVDTFMNAAVDAGIAMASLIGAAESMGLGCCPISVIRNYVDQVAELLTIPEGVFPVAGLTVGWPQDRGYMSMRLPPHVVVHRDRYDDSTLEASVAQYDDRRHERFPIADDKQRYLDRYGVQPDCRWSDNVARQLSVPERAGFREWLQKQAINLD